MQCEQNNDLTKKDGSILTGDNLELAVAKAEGATCDNSAEICCHKDNVIKPAAVALPTDPEYEDEECDYYDYDTDCNELNANCLDFADKEEPELQFR